MLLKFLVPPQRYLYKINEIFSLLTFELDYLLPKVVEEKAIIKYKVSLSLKL